MARVLRTNVSRAGVVETTAQSRFSRSTTEWMDCTPSRRGFALAASSCEEGQPATRALAAAAATDAEHAVTDPDVSHPWWVVPWWQAQPQLTRRESQCWAALMVLLLTSTMLSRLVNPRVRRWRHGKAAAKRNRTRARGGVVDGGGTADGGTADGGTADGGSGGGGSSAEGGGNGDGGGFEARETRRRADRRRRMVDKLDQLRRAERIAGLMCVATPHTHLRRRFPPPPLPLLRVRSHVLQTEHASALSHGVVVITHLRGARAPPPSPRAVRAPLALHPRARAPSPSIPARALPRPPSPRRALALHPRARPPRPPSPARTPHPAPPSPSIPARTPHPARAPSPSIPARTTRPPSPRMTLPSIPARTVHAAPTALLRPAPPSPRRPPTAHDLALQPSSPHAPPRPPSFHQCLLSQVDSVSVSA